MPDIFRKFKEIFWAVVPIVVIVCILNLFIISLDRTSLIKIFVGALTMLFGIPVFLHGIDLSITPIGDYLREVLLRKNNLPWLLIGAIILGFIASAAEPDLHILGKQMETVTAGLFNYRLMILLVSIVIGFMVALSLYRTIKNWHLKWIILVIYGAVFVLALFSRPEFLAMGFDVSGATTGSVSVPFLLALSSGISAMTRKDERERNDTFGILGIVSAGAILAVLFQGLMTRGIELKVSLPVEAAQDSSVLFNFLNAVPRVAIESLVTLLPIVLIFLFVYAKSEDRASVSMRRILIGTVYTYFGMIFFQVGVNVGFIPASQAIGYSLAAKEQPFLLLLFGAIFGMVTIPAEPSIHILTRRIEDETSAAIRAKTVMFALMLGVGLSVILSLLRILIPGLQLWHILLPVMMISICLAFVVPDIFVGIAFDSGGVASGTMTAVLVLPFAQGAAEYIPTANILIDGFGVIALVAVTPLITLQLLGLVYKIKVKRTEKAFAEALLEDEDELN